MAARPHHLLHDGARARTLSAVTRLEQATGRRIWVALRPRADGYLELALGVGAALALGVLGLLLFLPIDFSVRWVPIDVAAAFALGTLGALRAPRLLSLLLPANLSARRARALACQLFVEHQAKEPAASAALVYVSLLEQRVELVALPPLDGDLERAAVRRLEGVLHHRAALEHFAEALADLGPALATRRAPAESSPATAGIDDAETAA
ncbi:MAG: hypothetical protein ACYCWW_12840 [Deltaproteobacteria bacterium]